MTTVICQRLALQEGYNGAMPASLTDLWRLAREITTPLLVYQITASVFIFFSLVNACVDWFVFRRPVAPTSGPIPPLSVLIPARNEEAVIGECVKSLLANGYPGKLEVLVLDDRSEDRTGAIVAEIAASDDRVRLLTGGELLEGWKGKPNALRQLSAAATGEILLLTDADCTFYPDALAAAVRHRETFPTDCLSLCPYLTCQTFWEHVILPLQYYLVFTTLPIWAVYATKIPAFAAANGAFILLPAKLYADLGGHEPVKNEMAEDIKFSQHVKRSGYRLVYGDGSTTYAVRMYESLRGIWDGFSKNIYSAMGRSLPVVVFWSAFQFLTQILPFGFLAVALVTGNRTLAGFWLPLAHVAIALVIRTALALRFRQALWSVLTHPIGWLITVAMCWNSTYLALSGKGHAWKGRVYQQ